MENEPPSKRLGRLVRARRKSLKMTQADVQAAEGPSTATLRLIEGGNYTDFTDGTGSSLEAAIQWAPGSIAQTLDGGDPTPLNPPPVVEPRVVEGRNLYPHSVVSALVLTTEERATLAGARQKLITEDEMSDKERRLLATFLENEELRTLHARVDWLPRNEQLWLSTVVNDLHLEIEGRHKSGYDDQVLVPEDQPNPLPYGGTSPDDPQDINEGEADDVETQTEPNAPGEAGKTQEAGLPDYTEKWNLRPRTGEQTGQ